jgi:sugar lactone lactonase YvrE
MGIVYREKYRKKSRAWVAALPKDSGSKWLLRAAIALGLLLLLSLTAALSADAAGPKPFPKIIPLPDGFQPEGVAVGRGTTFYAGSLVNGAIYSGDLRTGQGDTLVPGQEGRIAAGLALDERSNYLFVAGGPTGQAYVYDAGTGAEVASYTLNENGDFINDVIVTRDAAYFTNSNSAVFYKLPLGPAGAVPGPSPVEEIPLTGDYMIVPGFNANGIEATADGGSLFMVNSAAGKVFRVDPGTGVATEIDLGGASVSNGDGLLLQGFDLYVVRNFFNQIAIVRLDSDLSTGAVVDTITDPAFDIPTTLAGFGSRLYTVNARFATPPTPNTAYDIVQISRH